MASSSKGKKGGKEKTVLQGTGKLKPPFDLRGETEIKLYQSLILRPVYNPRHIDLDFWQEEVNNGDETAIAFMNYLEELGLKTYATYSTPGYRKLMLEFFTTFVHIADGSFTCRFRNVEYTMTKEELDKFLEVDDRWRERDLATGFDTWDLWNELTGSIPARNCRYRVTGIRDHAIYLAHKFLTQGFLGKDDASKMSKPEMMTIFAMTRKRAVRLLPMIVGVVENVQKILPTKVAKLTMGTFISEIAKFWGVPLDNTDVTYPSQDMVVATRQFNSDVVSIPTFEKYGGILNKKRAGDNNNTTDGDSDSDGNGEGFQAAERSRGKRKVDESRGAAAGGDEFDAGYDHTSYGAGNYSSHGRQSWVFENDMIAKMKELSVDQEMYAEIAQHSVLEMQAYARESRELAREDARLSREQAKEDARLMREQAQMNALMIRDEVRENARASREEARAFREMMEAMNAKITAAEANIAYLTNRFPPSDGGDNMDL